MRTFVVAFFSCLCFGAVAQQTAGQHTDDLAWVDPNAEELYRTRPVQNARVLPSEAVPFEFVLVYDERGHNVMSVDDNGITMQDLDQLDPGNYLVVATDDRGCEVDREQLAIMRY